MSPTTSPRIPIGLRGIKIENFRSIASLELSFLDAFGNASDIVVLAGPNGCGKTSVLEACLLALGHESQLSSAYDLEAVHAGTDSFHIVAELQTPGGNVTYGYERSKKHQSRHHIVDVGCLCFSSGRAPRLVGSLPVPVGKQWGQIEDTESNRLQLAKQFLVNTKFHAFMSTGKNATGNGRSVYDESVERLNEVWRTFYSEATYKFTVEPVSEDPEAGFDVFLTNPGLGRVPVDALGSGQLELFSLFGSLLRQRFLEGILFIDEPELHLDPQWHGPLLKALRRFLPKVQLIVATHSPRICDSVMSFQCFFLLPDDDPRARAWQTTVEAVSNP